MKKLALAGLLIFSGAVEAAHAEGKLNLYNWGQYTNPKLIEKFEKQYGVDVTIDEYDSNETLLAKIRGGNTGYDLVVPSDYVVKVMIDDGMLAETNPSSMPNFKHMKKAYVDIYWDPGRRYSVPYQTGTTTFAIDTAKYKGDIDTFKLIFDPPPELRGRINMLDDMSAVIEAAERYLGVSHCSENRADLKKVNDLLQAAKPNWRTFSFDAMGKIMSGDVIMTQIWSGAAYRVRQTMPTVKYAYPKEGVGGWMDNVVVLKDAKNIENAKLFQNFIMDPENAALISEFSGYDNGIEGSMKFLPKDFASAPEITVPAKAPVPQLLPQCSDEVTKVYNQIWTNLRR